MYERVVVFALRGRVTVQKENRWKIEYEAQYAATVLKLNTALKAITHSLIKTSTDTSQK